MRHAALFVVLGCGCAPALTPPTATSPSTLVQPVAPADGSEAHTDATVSPSRCARVPVEAVEPVSPGGSLCADHRRAERALHKEFVRSYRKLHARNVFEVAFGCDPLLSDVESVVFETGAGHGGSLTVWHLTRAKVDDAFDVLGIAGSLHYQRAPKLDGQEVVLVARGRVPASKLDDALEIGRPALTVLFRELDQPTTDLSFRGYGSSANSHEFMAVRDAGGRELSRQYTGYPTPTDQHLTLGLDRAVAELTPLLDGFELKPEPPSDELRSWFSRHLASAWPRTDGEYAWWVRERLVAIAGRLQDRTAIPMVVDQLEWGLAQLEAAGEKRHELTERYLLEPLTILARLSDWDPRVDARGNAVGLVEAARGAIVECQR